MFFVSKIHGKLYIQRSTYVYNSATAQSGALCKLSVVLTFPLIPLALFQRHYLGIWTSHIHFQEQLWNAQSFHFCLERPLFFFLVLPLLTQLTILGMESYFVLGLTTRRKQYDETGNMTTPTKHYDDSNNNNAPLFALYLIITLTTRREDDDDTNRASRPNHESDTTKKRNQWPDWRGFDMYRTFRRHEM